MQCCGESLPGGGVVSLFKSRWLLLSLLLLGSFARTTPELLAQPASPPVFPVGERGKDGLLRFSRNVPGDAQPITIAADQITTWSANGQTVFLLRGQVLIQQNVVQVRFNQGVVWTTEDGPEKGRLQH